jgi:DNA-binding protein YbaB
VRTLQDEVDRISATAYSPDGLITAVVGGRGELAGITLDPRIYRQQDAAALGRAIAQTVRDAAGQAEREATRLTERLVGGPAAESTDPVFGPALHVLNGERSRGERSWGR